MNELKEAIRKRALGYDVPVEQREGNRVIKIRHVPADLKAIQMLHDEQLNLERMSTDELIDEAERLITRLKEERLNEANQKPLALQNASED